MSTVQQGFVSIILPIAILTIIISGFLITEKTIGLNFLESTPVPSSTPQPSTNSPSPLASPTPSPTPTTTPTLKPSPTAENIQTFSGTPPGGFSTLNVQTEIGNFRASIITLDKSAHMITDTASDNDCDKDCPTMPLADFVGRNGGFAGINGTYFCPNTYPECQDKKDSFDFPVYNSRLNKWINQRTLSWNDRSMIYQDGGGTHMQADAKNFSGGLTAGIVNFPGLINNGQIIVNLDPLSDKQKNRGTKGGIGFNDSHIFLVMAYNVNMLEFAHLFKNIGATYAINLDGGGSSALFYGGYKVGPGRALPNAVVFK